MTRENTVNVPVSSVQRLIMAADCYGVRYLDSDDLSEEAQELQDATEAMKDALSAASLHEGEGELRDAIEEAVLSGDWITRRGSPADVAKVMTDAVLKVIASTRSAPPPSVEVERLRGLDDYLFNQASEAESVEGRVILTEWADAIAALSRKQEPGVPTPGRWSEWRGGENPAPGKRVDTRFRGFTIDDQHNDPSKTWNWKHTGGSGDIIAYRIVPTPGGEGE